jgi:hypothetical protein
MVTITAKSYDESLRNDPLLLANTIEDWKA